MTTPELTNFIIGAAQFHGLPVPLVMAVVEQESRFNPAAVRAEPRYKYLWDVLTSKPFRKLTPAEDASEIPPKDFSAYKGVSAATEWLGQQWSWGPMQTMGAVAREHGFTGLYFTELCIRPENAIRVGCEVLKSYLKRFGGPFAALEAYNGGPGGVGHNPEYATEVMARMEKFQ